MRTADLSAPAPGDRVAAALRGFGPLGTAAAVAIALLGPVLEPLGAVLVLLWVWRSRTPWREIGYVRPRSWPGGLTAGLLLGVALKLVMKAIVMPLFGADPVNQAFHYLAGNTAALPGMIWLMVVGAGWGEETVFRGFLFERLGTLFGRGRGARTAIVLVTSLWFGLVHYPVQGLAGVEQATVVGLLYGTIFTITGRLWLLMCAHAAFDLTALALIYWNLESTVAHLAFT